MNKANFVQKATATDITDGKWKALVADFEPAASSLTERTIRRKDTAVIRKQKTMFPAVSILAFPEGNLRGSTFLTARLQTMSVTFDMGSKIASAIVVNRESEPDEVAA